MAESLNKKKLLAVIDPGHTGRTYNAGAVKGYYESQAVYELSLYEKEALEAYGIDVILTRKMNENPDLYERGQIAVRNGKTGGYGAVLFESNHTNAFNGKACGVTIIRSEHLPGSEKFGSQLAEAIVGVMNPKTGVTYNRGVTTKTQSNGADWYGVIRGAVSGATSKGQAAKGPVQYAYIVEHGFHDHPEECAFLAESSYLKAIAEAKAKVIAAYFGYEAKKNVVDVEDGNGKESTGVPYLVRVTVEDLHIRQEPTVLSPSVGFTGKGTFTIVEEAEGAVDREGAKRRWGRLKSGRGWICLDYTKRAAYEVTPKS